MRNPRQSMGVRGLLRPPGLHVLRRVFRSYRLWWSVAMGVNCGLAVGAVADWIVAYGRRLVLGSDFPAFYTGWSMVLSGLGGSLYDYRLQTVAQQQILDGWYLSGGLLPFYYPPHVALLFAPLALLSLNQAYLVWFFLQLGVLVGLGWALWRHLEAEGLSRRTRAVVISAVVALPEMAATLYLGAFSALMLLCLLNFALALRHKQDRLAGLWVLLITIKPQVAVIPVLILVATRRWKAVNVLIYGGLGVVLVTVSVFGIYVWADFVGAIYSTLAADASLGVHSSAMYNLRGIVAFVLGESSEDSIGSLSLLVFAAVMVFVCLLWSRRRSADDGFDARMAITSLAALVFSPHANPQDGVLLVVPALFFWHHLRADDGRGRVFGALGLVCPGAFWIAERGLDNPWARRLPTFVSIVLGLWMILSFATGGGSRTECLEGMPQRPHSGRTSGGATN